MSRPIRTYLDSGILIAANATTHDLTRLARDLLADPGRAFVTSRFVQLEVEPTARSAGHVRELEMLRDFFETTEHVPVTDELFSAALERAGLDKLKPLDALHVAAAIIGGCDELVTTELSPQGRMHRARGIRIVDLRTLA